MEKRAYVIASPGYAHFCGGIVVLHNLAHRLIQKGYEAYVMGNYTNPAWNVPLAKNLPPEKLKDLQHNGIIVYPDIIPYNPCRFTNAVKWWLGASQYAPVNQLTFGFCDKHQVSFKADHLLFLVQLELDIFKPPEIENRKGSCVYSGKGEGMVHHPVPEVGTLVPMNITPGCTLITSGFPNTRQKLAKLFQDSEVFYCYDNMTIMATEARLCGCPVIQVGYNTIQKDYSDLDEYGPYGIGMYDDKPDLEKLKSELPLFREMYNKRLEKTEKELDQFIELTQAWNPEGKYVEDLDPNGVYTECLYGHMNFAIWKDR